MVLGAVRKVQGTWHVRQWGKRDAARLDRRVE